MEQEYPGIPQANPHKLAGDGCMGLSMEKWFCWSAIGLAGVLLVLFLLDMILEMPFGGISTSVDIISMVACGVLMYLGWNAYRDLK